MEKKETLFGKCLTLFWTFFKIGLFTFGGGYAMIPLISREVVENKHWIEDQDILDVFAISESTPGPIAINSATFIGYKIAGVAGSASATFGVVLPSYLIITLISLVLRNFQDILIVKYAFFGIRAGVLALVIRAFYTMWKKAPHSLFAYGVMLAAFLAVAFFKINAIYVIIACGLFGLIYSLIALKLEKKEDKS